VLDKNEVESYVDKYTSKVLYFLAGFLIRGIEISYKTYTFVEDKIINKIKNANALQKIKVGEVWREYEDIYANSSYCDWVVLSLTKEIVTVSSIKNHSDFAVKEVEPRIIYEFWLKK
jgi:hypothetical protein